MSHPIKPPVQLLIRLFSPPKKNQTTRGTGADIIIIDEAAHVDPALFYKVIVPILHMKNTALLCLSSPEGDSNYYSGLMNLKNDDGSSFFKVIDCFQICDKCLKLERVKQIECRHVRNTAHWLSSKKKSQLVQLYKASPEDAIREFGGVVVSNYKPAFCKSEVEHLFTAECVLTHTAPKYIFTSCDPNGGGPSHMSICSAYFTPLLDKMIIIGMDSEAVRDDREEYLLLHRHYNRLLAHRVFREARHIFIPENNLGLESAHLDTMVHDIDSVETYWQKPGRPGVCKDGKATRGYQLIMANMLANNACRFDHDAFTVTREKTIRCMKDLLQGQMLRYHWEKKVAPDVMGKDRYALTGKVGTSPDDLLIAVMMCAFWGMAYINGGNTMTM